MFAEKYNKITKEIFTRIIKMAIITLGNIQGLSVTVLNESLPSIITLEVTRFVHVSAICLTSCR